ncbi:MAG: HNH endonuclease [Spirochaetaceae bacterium]|jgi:uncharacterized protein (TIGR02646 family)|nr:HNH endonuclease [Spirochaetaceae bacterium]
MIALIRPECPNPQTLVDENYADPVNKEALRQSTSGKCMYCESKFEHTSYAHVEHIKPKSKFPELTYSWDNLGFSCQVCNTNKGSKYDDSLPFINPYDENPKDHLVFLESIVFPRRGSERGEYTIHELDLNRAGLVERRTERIKSLVTMITAAFRTANESLRNQAIEEIQKEAQKDAEYSAMVESALPGLIG